MHNFSTICPIDSPKVATQTSESELSVAVFNNSFHLSARSVTVAQIPTIFIIALLHNQYRYFRSNFHPFFPVPPRDFIIYNLYKASAERITKIRRSHHV
jgi:hypothetical protein